MNFKKLLVFMSFASAAFTLSLKSMAGETACDLNGQKAVASDPAVLWGKLDNGFSYAIMKNSYPPERVSVRLMVRIGSLMEKDNEQGMAHYLEHLAFGGSKHFAPGTLISEFQKMGMSFGGDTNAYTSFDRTVYMLELPKGDDDSMKKALTIMRDYADGLLLKEETVEKERGIILSELRDRETVDYRQMKAQYDFVFDGTMIPKRFPIGVASVIREVKAPDFRRFYDEWYRSDLMTLVIAGNVVPAQAEKLVREAFESMTAKGKLEWKLEDGEKCGNGAKTPVFVFEKPLVPENRQIKTEGLLAKVHREPEANQVTVSIMTVRPYVWEADTVDYRRQDITRYMAYSMLQKRFRELQEKEGSTFLGAYAYTTNFLNHSQLANVTVASDKDRWRDAVQVAENELRRVLEFGFNQDELDFVKADMLRYFEQQAAAASTRENPDLANGIIDTLYERHTFSSPQDDLNLLKAVLPEITLEGCKSLFAEDWNGLGRRVFIVGNFAENEVTDATAMALYEEAAKKPLTALAETTVSAFAYTSFGEAGKIVKRESIKDLSIEKVTFENGVNLVIKKTDFQANKISVRARIGGGILEIPANKEGINLYLDRTFIDGGLEKHSREDLKKLFASKNVGVNFRTDSDSFILEGDTTPEDFLTECQLLAAYATAPGFRDESERLFKRGISAMYLKLNQSAEGVWQKNGLRYLLNDDFRFGIPDEAKLLAYDNAMAKAFLAETLKHGNMEIAIVGDCDPEAVIKGVAQTFGALQKRNLRKDFSAQEKVSVRSGGSMKIFEYPSELPRSLVAMSWRTANSKDIHLHRQLSLLSSILDDRLRVELREALGEAYSPYAYRFSRKTFDVGFQIAISLLRPEQTDSVVELIKKIGRDMAEKGVTQDEFDRALNPLLTEVRATVKTNPFWMDTISNSTLYPDQIDNSRTVVSEYEGMDIGTMNTLAKRYFMAENSIGIIVRPAAKPENQ